MIIHLKKRIDGAIMATTVVCTICEPAGRPDGKRQTILGVWFLPKHLDPKK